MRECDGRIVDIFTKGSHHHNLSLMFITHILPRDRVMRNIYLRSHNIICFKNPSNRVHYNYLVRQLQTNNTKCIQEEYWYGTKNAHEHSLYDLKQDTVERYRKRTKIFSSHSYQYYRLKVVDSFSNQP